MGFDKFLEYKYLEWQQSEGGRKTVKEFAKWLGVSQSSVSMWWNGERIPQGETIDKLAEKLGPEVYDALGLERPDPRLVYIQRVWEKLPHEAHIELARQAQLFFEQNKGLSDDKQNRLLPVDSIDHRE